MSSRLFEGQDHADNYKKFRIGPPDSCIQKVIEFLKDKFTGDLRLAVDLGCGNGQCTVKLANHFQQVLGTDVSQSQVHIANESLGSTFPNVTFEVSSADKIPLGDKTVQLITASCAAHWFDLPRVYEEGRRVLVSGGVMAFLCIDIFKDYVFLPDPSKNAEINDFLTHVDRVMLDGYWSPRVNVVKDRYKDIDIPFNDFTRDRGFINEIEFSVHSILGLYRSYSPFVTYCEVNGIEAGEQFMETVKNRLIAITGIAEQDLGKPLFINKEHYFLVMARL